MKYKEVLSIPTNMEQTTFNTTHVSAIGSLCGTYRPALCPVEVLSYLCRDEAFYCMSLSNYGKTNSVWCGRNTHSGGGEVFPSRQTL
jgi:hypothetical protein